MTDREKMAQIIAEHLCSQGKSHKRLYGAKRMCYSRANFAECEKVSKCVDALIAAGIGDVKEAERRAEVAERACRIATDKIYDYCYEEAIAQAEKELAEEKKE